MYNIIIHHLGRNNKNVAIKYLQMCSIRSIYISIYVDSIFRIDKHLVFHILVWFTQDMDDTYDIYPCRNYIASHWFA